jgi:hypothetical protein
MATATAMAIRGWQLDDGNWTTMMGQQRCDDDGWPATLDCTSIVSPLLPLRCSPNCTDLFALMLHWHHHRHCTGVVAPFNLACLRCCASVVTLVTLALLPLVRWHYHPHCRGLFVFVVLALCSSFAGIFTLVELACTKARTTW